MKHVDILNELIQKQLKNVDHDKKLNYNELKRLSKYINTTIFDETKCCMWNGYITNLNNPSKGVYINFYFRGKKPVLHRLLYANFVGQLNDDEYLKFICPNKGKCCNIKHLQKFNYVTSNENNKEISSKIENNKTGKGEIVKLKCEVKNVGHPISFTVNFN